jgi:thiamine biosynthesis lipoprotein
MNPSSRLSRRQFIKIFAAGSLAAGAGASLAAHGWPPPADAAVYRESRLLMGTVVNFSILADSLPAAQQALAACCAEMRRQAGLFTRFEAASPLAQLNTSGELTHPDPALVALLNQAQAISQASSGAFDITVKPLLDCYEHYQSQQMGLPPLDELHRLCALVGFEKVEISRQRVRLGQPGMALTLDGIAKGAVIDAGVAVLKAHGFSSVIVEAGGDLLAAGAHAAQPWKIGLRSPRANAALTLPTLAVRDRAVATSGDYLQPFSADFSANHILDPRQGLSSPELASATILAPSAVLADSLATAVMVLGVREGLELLKQFPGCEAYLIQKDLHTTASSGLSAYLA